MDQWQVVFTKFMDLRMRSKGGKTTMRLELTLYYILLVMASAVSGQGFSLQEFLWWGIFRYLFYFHF